MSLKSSVILLAISIFLAGLANQVQACDGHGSGYYGPRTGHVPQMLPPTGYSPGYWRRGTIPGVTTITIERK